MNLALNFNMCIKKTMDKILLKKLLIITFFFISSYSLLAQEKFNLNAQLLVDKKAIENAEVTVFEGQTVLVKTFTNKIGKFNIDLPFQKIFVFQFKKEGYPIFKVLISTKSSDLDEKMTKAKLMVLTLLSSNPSNEGPDIKDVSASYQFNNSGLLVQEEKKFSGEVIKQEDELKENEKEIESLKEEINTQLSDLSQEEKKEMKSKYETVYAQLDSLLFLSQKQYALIIQSANLKSEEIVKEAYFKLPEVLETKKKKSLSNTNNIDNELKDYLVDEKKFNNREDIKALKLRLNQIENKTSLSKKDSVEYFETIVQFRDEMLKSAKMQLEIDKLNAKTKEDSLVLQKRETEIFLAEQEIEDAKNKIEIQQLEIQQKNTMLMFSISALLFFIILSILVYNSFRLKKRTNILLEKQNLEIANKNQKIIDSIRYAQTIQQAILPIKSNIDKYFDWFVIFQPKDIVSGDFYWFNHFEDSGKSVFAVVDCTGHGVPGAFMSMIGNRLLIEAVKEKGIIRPVDILEEIDRRIKIALMQEETSNNDGMDICVCTLEYLDNNKCKIDFAGAKRPLFYSDIQNNKMEHIKGTVRGIGGKKRIREKAQKLFEEHSLTINKGEMIYLTSDGYFDIQSPGRKKFGRQSFIQLLEANMHKTTIEQKEILIDAFHLHKDSEQQIDDITILGIKI